MENEFDIQSIHEDLSPSKLHFYAKNELNGLLKEVLGPPNKEVNVCATPSHLGTEKR